eukprot:9255679-Alexandrium_andersonii.AAC.1
MIFDVCNGVLGDAAPFERFDGLLGRRRLHDEWPQKYIRKADGTSRNNTAAARYCWFRPSW